MTPAEFIPWANAALGTALLGLGIRVWVTLSRWQGKVDAELRSLQTQVHDNRNDVGTAHSRLDGHLANHPRGG